MDIKRIAKEILGADAEGTDKIEALIAKKRKADALRAELDEVLQDIWQEEDLPPADRISVLPASRPSDLYLPEDYLPEETREGQVPTDLVMMQHASRLSGVYRADLKRAVAQGDLKMYGGRVSASEVKGFAAKNGYLAIKRLLVTRYEMAALTCTQVHLLSYLRQEARTSNRFEFAKTGRTTLTVLALHRPVRNELIIDPREYYLRRIRSSDIIGHTGMALRGIRGITVSGSVHYGESHFAALGEGREQRWPEGYQGEVE